MHYILSALSAMLIAVMILVNGVLTQTYGLYEATVIIHIVGLVLITFVCLVRREPLFRIRGIRLTAFLGGAVGVFTTIFNNECYGKIDVSAIIALNLVGQAVSSIVIDQFGLFGMPVSQLTKTKLLGLIFAVGGVCYMLIGTTFSFLPVLLSLLTGLTLALNRHINAQLSEHTNALIATFYNYVIGLPISIAACLMLAKPFPLPTTLAMPMWMYLGGAIGVVIVLQSNFSTHHVPALYMTFVVFVGQIFMGLVLDAFLTGAFPMQNLIGGLCVMAGLCFNVFFQKRKSNL